MQLLPCSYVLKKEQKRGDVLLNFKRFLIRQELPDNHKQKYTDVINATRSALRTNGDSEAFASALFKLSQHITKNIESSTADPHYKSKTPLSVRVEGAFVSTTVFTYPNKLIRILDHLNYRSENPNITSKRILIGPHAASRRQDDAKFLENDAVNYSAPKLVLKDGSEIQMKRFENLTEDDKRSIQTDQTSTRVVLNVPAFGVLNHGIGTARANKFLVTLLRSIYEDVIPGHFRTDIPIAFSGGNIEISVKKEYFDIATLEEFSNKCSKVAFNSLINIIRRPNDEKWINGSSRFIKTMASIYLELQVKQFLKGESEVTPYSAYPKVEATLSS